MKQKLKHYFSEIKNGRLTRMKSQFRWLLHFGKSNIIYIVIFTVLGMSGTVISLLSSLVSRDLVDIITGHNSGELIKTFVLTIVIQLLSILLSNVSRILSERINLKISNKIKSDLYRTITDTKWEALSEYHSGDLMARWLGDSASVVSGLLTFFPGLITSIFHFVSALYMVVRYDASFAIFSLASFPITLIASRKVLKRMRDGNLETIKISAATGSFAQESFENLQTVKAFNMLSFNLKRLRQFQKDGEEATLKYQKVTVISTLIMTLISLLVTYSTYGWGIYKVWSGVITYGTMTMFLSLSTSLSGTIQSLLNTFPNAVSLTNAIQRIIDISELPKDDYSHEDEVREFFEKNSGEGVGIHIRNASYTYPNGTEVFFNVNLDADPHEAVALVGPSGEGKTTMLRLMLSIITPVEGCGYISAGGRPFSEDESLMLTASARQLFAYVPQGNTMFSGSIAENMRNVKEDATDEEIIDALKIACAWDFVSRLPDGIETQLQERGGGFSEGQAQRLSIARAILRKSPILLLDEATSALDVDTERRVLKNIMDDSYPRTTIVTTHRPTVLTVCDRVYAIRNRGCDILSKAEIDDMIKAF